MVPSAVASGTERPAQTVIRDRCDVASNDIIIGGSDTSKPLALSKRIGVIRDWIALPDTRILDAGCGEGGYVLALCDLGARAEGVEYLSEKVERWQTSHPGDARVKRGDLAALDYPDARFDAVILNEVLEHVPDDTGALRELHRVMKPDGTLILFSPNRFHPFETHGVISKKTGVNGGFVRTFLLPYLPVSIGSRRFRYWARNYWPKELRKLVERNGFQVVAQSYVWQTFENVSGSQPAWIARLVPLLRVLSSLAERLPVLRIFGASQLVVARRLAIP